MKLATLRELYVSELRDLYNAENQILKALPKMVKAASSEELKNARRHGTQAIMAPLITG